MVRPKSQGARKSPPTVHRELDLDVVRGLAILLAMGWHLTNRLIGIAPLDVLLYPARTFGWVGVDLFFVLSGFLVGPPVPRQGASHAGAGTR